MLSLNIPANELFDEERGEFITLKPQTLQLEHSLISLSKWESKWCKPFLSRENRPVNEIIDYVKCMTITGNVDPIVYRCLTKENLDEVQQYIDSPMTATTFSDRNPKPSREIITSELIYYWMISAGIPFECQKWHLNRLLTLIRVCSIKNTPAKKMNKAEILAQNANLNKIRKAASGTKG